MASASVIFDIIGRDRASAAFKKVGDASQKTSGKLSSMGDKLKGIGKVAGVAAAAAGAFAIKVGVDAIKNASDLNETINKANTIFGAQAKGMQTWADGAAKNLGMSKAAALEAASGFGNMFSQLGFTGKQAASMSKDVVQLSTDLGSFNNLPTAEVTDMISGAMRGEYDSLQRLIPNINAARVEHEALTMTGKKNADQLTAQEKAAATLSIIHKDGAAAAGDFAKTSGGLANQQKILKAQLEDVSGKIGAKLLPIAVKLIKYFNEKALPAIERMGKWLGDKLGPVFEKVAGFVQDKLIPAAKDMWHWFAEKILPSVRDVAKFVADDLVPAVMSFWHWVAVKLLPPAKEFAEGVMVGLRGAIENVSKALSDNRPFLEGLFNAVKAIVEIAVTKLLPLFGDLAKTVLPLLGTAFGVAIGVIKTLTDAFLTLGEWGVRAFGFLLNAAMVTFEGILDAAALGLGWIPVIGDKIKGARNAFHNFRTSTVEQLNAVADKIKGVKDALAGIKDKHVKISVSFTGDQTVYRASVKMWESQHASGTTYAPGGVALVGERGPELVRLSRGAQVIPNHRLGGMGGGTVNVYFNGLVTDPRATAREIQRILLQQKRTTGTALGLA